MGPLAPEARIIPIDQLATDIFNESLIRDIVVAGSLLDDFKWLRKKFFIFISSLEEDECSYRPKSKANLIIVPNELCLDCFNIS